MIWERKYGDFFPKTARFRTPSFYFTKWNAVSLKKAAKNVVRKCYSQCYSSEVQRQLAAGVGTHDVAVHLRLFVLKAKHWIVEIYNKFQSGKGVTIIKSGFRNADFTAAFEMMVFSEQDPF